MTAYRLTPTTDRLPGICGQIGGAPRLPDATAWPRCRLCNSELVAFLEIVLPPDESSPFQPGSTLQVFACRQHDDIAGTIYSDYAHFASASCERVLPAEYWNLNDGHYLLRLLPPAQKSTTSRQEPRLIHQFVSATAAQDDSEDGFKLFGEPHWLQDAQPHTCCCGAPMRLLLQVPDGYAFPMAEGAQEQPNSFSLTDYCLFLGNQLYLLGCTRQCDPRALWPVLQN